MTTTPNETANAEATQLKSEWSKPELIQLNTADAQGKLYVTFEQNSSGFDIGPS